jgi:hypothetical protein
MLVISLPSYRVYWLLTKKSGPFKMQTVKEDEEVVPSLKDMPIRTQ